MVDIAKEHSEIINDRQVFNHLTEERIPNII